ncbi:hypothetical protein GALMADRAFT_603806 [Galerina marginata CBS 339.88]|uniref:Uncharacterized protein n=1 Tax=Galerina marginata (strain CBS 339.88) TaxID=685588 RepID=A0A067ST41_GALM3|nr:hypothetical protein GALMADRAFT_603806 [Galerina marginata CBS 339.88]
MAGYVPTTCLCSSSYKWRPKGVASQMESFVLGPVDHNSPDSLHKRHCDKAYPVVDFISGYRFWALSFDDNRVAYAILAYDRNNKLLGQETKNGACYITSITIQNDQVNFIGQSNSSVTCTTDELYNLTIASTPDPSVPLVTTADANAQPSPPDGLEYIYFNGDEAAYPVLRYSGITYWALSYVDNCQRTEPAILLKLSLMAQQFNS